MVSRGVVPAVVVLFGVTLSAGAAAPAPTPDLDRKAALERAAREEKPVVLFARPDKCRAPKKAPDPCRRLEAAVRHPAIQRRLARVVYFSTHTEDEQPSITVLDPGGVPIVRWLGAPDPPTFRHVLTLVDGAAPNLVAAARARSSGDARLAAREECLATLALGSEASGRARLLALRNEGDAETKQLAAIWLGRLDARGNDTNLDEDELSGLAREGATSRVRFEAWMSIGERQLAEGRGDDAAIAFRTALDLAGDSVAEREAALAALARSAETAKPVIGLGSAGSIVTGRRTIQPKWNEKKAHRVEYRLDSRSSRGSRDDRAEWRSSSSRSIESARSGRRSPRTSGTSRSSSIGPVRTEPAAAGASSTFPSRAGSGFAPPQGFTSRARDTRRADRNEADASPSHPPGCSRTSCCRKGSRRDAPVRRDDDGGSLPD